MAVAARVVPDPARPVGHARIVLAGLDPPADPRFGLVREGFAAAHLGPAGWQVGEALLAPLAVEREAEGFALIVGPAVCRHLEPGPLILRLPAAGIETPLFWPASVAVFDPAEATIAVGERAPPRAAPPPPPAPPPAAPAPAAPPAAPATARPAPRRRFAALAAVAALLLLAGGGGAWWFLGRPAPPPGPPAPAPWPEGTDHLTPAEVVARAPDAAAIHAVALRRQAQGRHDDALVLFEEAADRGVAAALTALARLYDPVGFRPGRPFSAPDPRLAALYYRRAAQAGDGAAAAPRAALRAHLEREAAAGSPTARDALQEFWP